MLTITEDSTNAELQEAITHLRARQRRCQITSTRDEINETINELLDRLSETP